MRQVTRQDAPEIARLIHEIWADHNLNPERIARVSLESNHITLIETQKDTVIGFVDGFTTVSSDGALRWEIDLLGVHPAYRGRGLAQALIAASVGYGRQAGAVLARALVKTDNVPSLVAFRRCGFGRDDRVYTLFVSGEERRERQPAPPNAHLIAVSTLTYRGVWVEGALSYEALRCAQSVRTRYGWEAAGVVLPEGAVAAEQVGYEYAGRYVWMYRAL